MVEDYQENYKTGYISLFRSIKNHWIFQNDQHFKWWIIMLLEANFKSNKLVLGYDIYEIQRGQCANSLRTWAELFNCSTKTVTKFFDLLQKDKMIYSETIGKGKRSTTLININKYNEYQLPSETQEGEYGKRKGNATETLTTFNRDTTNKDNNDNNDNNKSINEETKVSAKIDFEKLLEYFNSVTQKKCKVISTKTKNQFNARLKEGYTKEDIMSAIKNCSKDSYHIENPKYLTLEFISRSDKIDKYSNYQKKDEFVGKGKFEGYKVGDFIGITQIGSFNSEGKPIMIPTTDRPRTDYNGNNI